MAWSDVSAPTAAFWQDPNRGYILTEDGEYLVTEDGERIISEDVVQTTWSDIV